MKLTLLNKSLLTMCFSILIMSLIVPTVVVKARIKSQKNETTLGVAFIPSGFNTVISDNGVVLYKKDHVGG